MNDKTAQKAVKAALSGDWHSAIDLNKQILQDSKDDIDALNRLARAYAAAGNLDKAMKTSQKVLDSDPENPIAKKSLERWRRADKGGSIKVDPADPKVFLEETGKTKLIPLINLGDDSIISQLSMADEVHIKAHNHKVCVYTTDEKYIGRLPDDVAARLKQLIKMGNKYKTYVKSISNDSVQVFVREVSRSKKLENVPSFSTKKVEYISIDR